MTENNSTKTIRIKAETLLRLYGMKALVGIDSGNNMPTCPRRVNIAGFTYRSGDCSGEEAGGVTFFGMIITSTRR